MNYKKLLLTISLGFVPQTLLQGSALQNLFADHTSNRHPLQKREEIVASKMNCARSMQWAGALGLAGYFGHTVKGKLQQYKTFPELFPRKHIAGTSAALATSLLGWYWQRSLKIQEQAIKQNKATQHAAAEQKVREAQQNVADARERAQKLAEQHAAEQAAEAKAAEAKLAEEGQEAKRKADEWQRFMDEVARKDAAEQQALALERQQAAAAQRQALAAQQQAEEARQQERQRRIEAEQRRAADQKARYDAYQAVQERILLHQQQAVAARAKLDVERQEAKRQADAREAERNRLYAEEKAAEARQAEENQREFERLDAEAKIVADFMREQQVLAAAQAEQQRLADAKAKRDKQAKEAEARAAADAKAREDEAVEIKQKLAQMREEDQREKEQRKLATAAEQNLKNYWAIARKFYQAAQVAKKADDVATETKVAQAAAEEKAARIPLFRELIASEDIIQPLIELVDLYEKNKKNRAALAKADDATKDAIDIVNDEILMILMSIRTDMVDRITPQEHRTSPAVERLLSGMQQEIEARIRANDLFFSKYIFLRKTNIINPPPTTTSQEEPAEDWGDADFEL